LLYVKNERDKPILYNLYERLARLQSQRKRDVTIRARASYLVRHAGKK